MNKQTIDVKKFANRNSLLQTVEERVGPRRQLRSGDLERAGETVSADCRGWHWQRTAADDERFQ